ncbi:MAG TPA: SDR family NAD(P)-dependent oxidoreductase [Alphaproteobacteria bacterium]|nr:SDR family NAD(P)-dependent oxidoreductase [Alphaproteobacteria bacterium]
MTERFLEGRTAWVTGGATGIGRAIAMALAKAGADVAIGSLLEGSALPERTYAARPSRKALEDVAAEIRGEGVRCLADGFDVRVDASVDAFHRKATSELASIDILVNAAGVSAQEEMTGHSDETWYTVLDINLTGVYRTIRRCMGPMIERRWGRIVNIASTAANVGAPRYSAYCASKSALLGLTRCVALEGAEHGVTCNAVNPGSVGTEMMRLGSLRRIAQGGEGATVEENFARIAASMPQKRLVEPAEIAELVVFLCRDEALGLTGEDLTVSGGALW